MWIFYFCALLLVSIECKSKKKERPNIVFMVADDLGWDDVSLHGSHQIMTPNIDTLGYQGIIIPQYYTDCHGTPSRSALFTGKYPMRMGTQGASIGAAEDRGVPPSERLLPEYLSELGYSTHLVGKWDVGKSRQHYLPTNRGFQTFYGFLGSSVDYYTYNKIESWDGSDFYGLDFFNDSVPIEDQRGHLDNLLTDQTVQLIRNHNTSVPLYLHVSYAAPHAGGGLVNLQVSEETIAANDHIAHSARRLYAGLVTGMDTSIGNVIAALAEKNILHNTIIVFVSDNGAPSIGFDRNFGSNLPLRGTKGSPWEGAVRSTAIIWHASLPSKIWSGLFHVTDWLPTLIAAARGDTSISEKLDGINQWSSLKSNAEYQRNDLLVTVDDLRNWAAFRDGNYKLIIGDVDKQQSGFYNQDLKLFRLPVFPYTNVLLNSEAARVFKETLYSEIDVDAALKKQSLLNIRLQINTTNDEQLCTPTKLKGCLFDLSVDPLETNDLWDSQPDVVRKMIVSLRSYWPNLKARRAYEMDTKASPANRNFVWLPWLKNQDQELEVISIVPPFPLEVSVGELQYVTNLKLKVFKKDFVEYMQKSADAIVGSISALFSF